jgi:hypothetical protein
MVSDDLSRPGLERSAGEVIATEAMRLWAAVRASVDAGRRPASVIAAFGSWTRSPILPGPWRLAETESFLAIPDIDLTREWDLVQGVVGLADHDLLGALRVLCALVRGRDVAAMTAMSEYADRSCGRPAPPVRRTSFSPSKSIQS